MRILIYWEQESWGGVDTHLLELLTTWPDRGDEFVIVSNEGNAGFSRLEDDFRALPHVCTVVVRSDSYNEVRRRLRQKSATRYLGTMLHFLQPVIYWYAIQRLHQVFIGLGRFDLMLSNNGGYPAAWGALCAIEAGKKMGIKTRLLLVHHAATPAGPFMGWFEQLVDRRISRIATALVCVSEATKNTLLSRRWLDDEILRIRVIHNSISAREESTSATMPNIREMVGADASDRLICVAGRVEPYKGQEDLIFALARLSSGERARLRLVIIGSGDASEMDRLRRIARSLGVADRVHLLGYVPGRPADLIRQMDLLAVATRSFEGFGLTLAEAMSVGVPVLATRVGAIPEFVDQTIGFLVPPGCPACLAQALSDFLAAPEVWGKRAVAASERLRHEGESMAVEYRRLFKECMA